MQDKIKIPRKELKQRTKRRLKFIKNYINSCLHMTKMAAFQPPLEDFLWSVSAVTIESKSKLSMEGDLSNNWKKGNKRKKVGVGCNDGWFVYIRVTDTLLWAFEIIMFTLFLFFFCYLLLIMFK